LESLLDAGWLGECEVVGVEVDELVLPEMESRLRKFKKVSWRLIPSDFLDLVVRRRSQSELWQTVTRDPEFENAFDVVIANPPYVRTQVLGAKKARQLAIRYGLRGRVDLYHAFLVAATETIRPGGHIGIITSNRFLSTLAGASIRAFLAKNYDIKELVDLGDTKLFEAAVLPAIFVGRRPGGHLTPRVQTRPRFLKVYSQRDQRADTAQKTQAADGILPVLRRGVPGLYQTREGLFRLTTGELVLGNNPQGVWRLITRRQAGWLSRIRKAAWAIFKDIAVVRVGIKTTANDVFIRRDWHLLPQHIRPETELLRPLLRHENARRWSSPEAVQATSWRVLYPHEVSDGIRKPVDLRHYPRARAYLERNKGRLEKRQYVIEAGRQWYEIWVPQDPNAWAGPKIVFPDISPEPRFCLDRSGCIVDGDCYWITLRPGVRADVLYLLLALANSTLMTRFHDLAFNNRLYSGRRRYITQYVGQYPCPDPELAASKELIALAKEIVRETREGADQKKLRFVYRKIDRLARQAFGIDPCEPAI